VKKRICITTLIFIFITGTIIAQENGVIAFSITPPDANNEIYVINADGTGLTQLTNHEGRDCGPDWSPDGTQYVFSSNRDGDSEIYIMNIDGTDITQITYNNAEDWWPSWSPDGSQITFMSNRDGNFEIYIMDASGTNQTRLTTDPAQDAEPVWSPDGSMIAFLSFRDGNFEIYTMDTYGNTQERLTYTNGHAIQPAWKLVTNAIQSDEIQNLKSTLKNYPNPFNPETAISFQLQKESEVELIIYNIKSQKVKNLTNELYSEGEHSIIWNGMDDSGKSVSTGIYFYKLNVNNKIIDSKKMILMK